MTFEQLYRVVCESNTTTLYHASDVNFDGVLKPFSHLTDELEVALDIRNTHATYKKDNNLSNAYYVYGYACPRLNSLKFFKCEDKDATMFWKESWEKFLLEHIIDEHLREFSKIFLQNCITVVPPFEPSKINGPITNDMLNAYSAYQNFLELKNYLLNGKIHIMDFFGEHGKFSDMKYECIMPLAKKFIINKYSGAQYINEIEGGINPSYIFFDPAKHLILQSKQLFVFEKGKWIKQI